MKNKQTINKFKNRVEIKKQVPTLELCKKLKELGYPQDGLFWWNLFNKKVSYGVETTSATEVRVVVAPTVAELGEWLPNDIDGNAQLIDSYKGLWLVGYAGVYENGINYEKTEADARARVLIWLVENDYINFEKQK